MNIECRIERQQWVQWKDDDGRDRSSDWGREPYIVTVGTGVRVDPPSDRRDAPTSHFRLYSPLFDFEHDQCSLVMLDIVCPTINALWYPRLEIVGFVGKMCAVTAVDPNGEGDAPRYSPSPDPDWKPGIVRVTLRPVNFSTPDGGEAYHGEPCKDEWMVDSPDGNGRYCRGCGEREPQLSSTGGTVPG